MVTVLVQGKEVARDSDLNTYISKENIIHQPDSLKKWRVHWKWFFFFLWENKRKVKGTQGSHYFPNFFFFFPPLRQETFHPFLCIQSRAWAQLYKPWYNLIYIHSAGVYSHYCNWPSWFFVLHVTIISNLFLPSRY